MSSRKCEICNIHVHRASYVKYFRSKKHLEKEKHNQMIIPESLIQEPIENKLKKIYNPESLKRKARDDFRSCDKQFKKDLAKKVINPY